MDKYAEEHDTFIDSLKVCEYDLMVELLEAGATWDKAVKTLKETNEKLGEPIKRHYELRGRKCFVYEWAEPKEEIEEIEEGV